MLEDIKFGLQMGLISLGFAALLVASAVANAFVLVMMWGWYIAPYFSVPSLDMIHAFAVFWIVTLFTQKTLPGSREQKASIEGVNPMTLIMAPVTYPAMVLLIGWAGTIWL